MIVFKRILIANFNVFSGKWGTEVSYFERSVLPPSFVYPAMCGYNVEIKKECL